MAVNEDGKPGAGGRSRAGWAAGVVALLGAALVLLVGLRACGRLAQDDSLGRVQRAGELRVGYSVEAPYAMVAPDGRVTGAFAELTRLASSQARLGRITWVQLPLASLIPALQEGHIDVAAAGLFITPERQRLVGFSRPVVAVLPGWLTRQGNPKALGAYAAVSKRADVKVIVIQGSVEHAFMSALGLPAERLLTAPDTQAAQALLAAGRADGLALSLPTVAHLATTLGSCCQAVPAEVDRDSAAPQHAALAYRLGDRGLMQALDLALEDLEKSPTLRETMARFGFSGATLLPAPLPHR